MGLKKEITTKGDYHVRCRFPVILAVVALLLGWLLVAIKPLWSPNFENILLAVGFIALGVFIYIRKSSTWFFSKITAILAAITGLAFCLMLFMSGGWLVTLCNWAFILFLVSMVLTNDFYFPVRVIQAVAAVVAILGALGIWTAPWAWLGAVLQIAALSIWVYLSYQRK